MRVFKVSQIVICEALKTQVKLNLNFTRSQCDYLLIICKAKFMQTKFATNASELRFECELEVQIGLACNCIPIKNTLYFTHKSLKVS